ncbi:MAG: hypothetical protein ACR2GD_12870 [Pyrinomonadaceae bacterium]
MTARIIKTIPTSQIPPRLPDRKITKPNFMKINKPTTSAPKMLIIFEPTPVFWLAEVDAKGVC